MARYNFEDMNRLEFLDARDAKNLRGPRNLPVTGRITHIAVTSGSRCTSLGYEHTLITALADFLNAPTAEHRFIRIPRTRRKRSSCSKRLAAAGGRSIAIE